MQPPGRAHVKRGDPLQTSGIQDAARVIATPVPAYPLRVFSQTVAGSSEVIYKLPYGILPANFLKVFGMWHVLAMPKAAARKGGL